MDYNEICKTMVLNYYIVNDFCQAQNIDDNVY